MVKVVDECRYGYDRLVNYCKNVGNLGGLRESGFDSSLMEMGAGLEIFPPDSGCTNSITAI
jgi:hypothetical protein